MKVRQARKIICKRRQEPLRWKGETLRGADVVYSRHVRRWLLGSMTARWMNGLMAAKQAVRQFSKGITKVMRAAFDAQYVN